MMLSVIKQHNDKIAYSILIVVFRRSFRKMAQETESPIGDMGLVSGSNNGLELISVGRQIEELKQYKHFVANAVHPREELAGKLVLANSDIKTRKDELDKKTITKKRQEIKTKRDEIEKEEDPKEIVKLIATVKKLRTEIEPLAKVLKEDKALGGMHEGRRELKKELDEKVSAVRNGLGELGYQI